ncbi:MAG: NAD(+)/NADH kinase [archaeon]|nr:NAD(+)/NADH kinase [archaeon]
MTIEILRKIADAVARAIHRIPKEIDIGKEICIGADGTPTSEIDKIAEDAVLEFIKLHGVHLNVLSEEIGFVDNKAEETLILDPIDGSSNSKSHIPLFTVSMAIGKKSLNDIHTAYIRNLTTNDEYFAEKNKGAFFNGARIHSKTHFEPEKSCMMIYLGRGASHRAHSLTKRIKSVRELGCSSLEMVLVATGASDGYFVDSEIRDRAIRIVDIAASTLILRESGGEVYNSNGEILDMSFDISQRSNFLAVANSEVYAYVVGNALTNPNKRIKYGIYANLTIPIALNIASRVIKSLDLAGEGYTIEENLATAMKLKGTPISMMHVDIMVVIGGDGTILRALQNTNATIIGINAGRIGFLTEIEINNIEEEIAKLVRGDYSIQKKFKISVSCNGKIVGEALNDVVIHSDSITKTRCFKIYIDNTFITDIQADGVLFSTPTGSTSYALSLGGPIVDPEVNAILMVPMAAFKFSSKQTVIPASKKITIDAVSNEEYLLVIDGQKELKLSSGSSIELTKSLKSSSFIVFNKDFYSRVRDKLKCFL